MKFFFLLAALSLFSTAHADSIGVLSCGTDKGISVEISKLLGARKMDALIAENSLDAESFYSNFQVTKKGNGYKGKNFELRLGTRVPRIGSTVVIGHLTAVTEDGRSLESNLECEVY